MSTMDEVFVQCYGSRVLMLGVAIYLGSTPSLFLKLLYLLIVSFLELTTRDENGRAFLPYQPSSVSAQLHLVRNAILPAYLATP